jgi:hypothetical protein
MEQTLLVGVENDPLIGTCPKVAQRNTDLVFRHPFAQLFSNVNFGVDVSERNPPLIDGRVDLRCVAFSQQKSFL